MAFQVTDAKWLKTEGDRVEQFILMPKFWGVEWTRSKLQRALANIGLVYTRVQIAKLNDELHKRGIVTDSQANAEEIDEV